MLIDTHCHLTYDGLVETQDAVLARAKAAGVMRFVSIGTDLADGARVIATVRKYPQVFAALGIHPHHAAEAIDPFEGFLETLLKSDPKVLAVGECDLDYHGHSGPREVQHRVYQTQLHMARRLQMPLVLHVREAHADALAIMHDFPDLSHVVHCFTGTPAECRQWLERGAYIGITGVVTYKNAADVREAAKLVPADRLLVETDAPYLSPEPVRKIKINEPAHVAHTARFIAELRGISYDELCAQTTANASRLFGGKLVAP